MTLDPSKSLPLEHACDNPAGLDNVGDLSRSGLRGEVHEALDRHQQALRAVYAAAGAHDLGHAVRVANVAAGLARGSYVDVRLAVLAGLFHDAGHLASADAERNDHHLHSADIANRRLAGVLTVPQLGEVTTAIRQRRYRFISDPLTPLGEVLSDADNLDALGLIGVARVFMWAGEHRPSHSELNDRWRLPHYYLKQHSVEKLSSLPDAMHSVMARDMARAKLRSLEAFADELARELP